MRNGKKWFVSTLLCGALAFATGSVYAQNITKPFANKSFYCKGGNESSGHNYFFRASSSHIERLDYRFPKAGVVFTMGGANKGDLADNWSFETLSEVHGERLRLYERVSMQSSSQTKHIYRTYEMYARGDKLFMILYDGVNGARDWKIKTTRICGSLVNNKVVQGKGNRYWATTLFSK